VSAALAQTTKNSPGAKRLVLERAVLSLEPDGTIRLDGLLTRPVSLFEGFDMGLPDEWKLRVVAHAGELREHIEADRFYWPIGIVERQGIIEVVRHYGFLTVAALCGLTHVYILRQQLKQIDLRATALREHFLGPALLRVVTDHRRLIDLLREGLRRHRPILTGRGEQPGQLPMSGKAWADLAKTLTNHLSDAKTLNNHLAETGGSQTQLPMRLPRKKQTSQVKQKKQKMDTQVVPAAGMPAIQSVLPGVIGNAGAPDAAQQGDSKQGSAGHTPREAEAA